MLKSIGIGAELFHKLIENDCYYDYFISSLKMTAITLTRLLLSEPCLRKTRLM